jgi:hypothetical protein
MPHSLPILSLFFYSLVTDKYYKLCNTTLYILFHPVPFFTSKIILIILFSNYQLINGKCTLSYKHFFMLFIPCIFLQSVY